MRETLRREFAEVGFEGLGCWDGVDVVGRRAVGAVRRVRGGGFGGEGGGGDGNGDGDGDGDEDGDGDGDGMGKGNGNVRVGWSRGFAGEVGYVRAAVGVEGVRVGFSRGSRPNGFDGGGGRWRRGLRGRTKWRRWGE